MNAATNFLYRQITHIGRGVTLAQGLKMRLSGEENIPDEGGAVLVCNHTGYMDFLFGAFLAYRKKRLVRFLAKAGIFKAPLAGPLLKAMHHVPVDRIDGSASMRQVRGFMYWVMRLMAEPLPAASRPSITMTIRAPVSTTHCCISTSSAWSRVT